MGIPFRERLLHSAGAISSIDGGRHAANITLRPPRKKAIFVDIFEFVEVWHCTGI